MVKNVMKYLNIQHFCNVLQPSPYNKLRCGTLLFQPQHFGISKATQHSPSKPFISNKLSIFIIYFFLVFQQFDIISLIFFNFYSRVYFLPTLPSTFNILCLYRPLTPTNIYTILTDKKIVTQENSQCSIMLSKCIPILVPPS